MKHKSIQESLEQYAARTEPSGVDPIDTPVYELLAATLFEIANTPNPKVRGGLARASRAQAIILDRLVGRRRAGTHPAQVGGDELDFVDLTVSSITEGEDDEEVHEEAQPGASTPVDG